MDGKAFLEAAELLIKEPHEWAWRSAAGRASYALLNEAAATLRRWGWSPPPHDRIHSAVRLKLTYASDPGLFDVGDSLDRLLRLRNAADYDLSSAGSFADDVAAARAIEVARHQIASLGAIDSNSVRRVAAIASLPKYP